MRIETTVSVTAIVVLAAGVLALGACASRQRAPEARTGAQGGDAGVPTGSIRGVVLRGTRDLPDAGREVTLEIPGAAPRKESTDGWGRFAFDDVPAGLACEVAVQAERCATVRVTGVSLQPGETRAVGTLRLDRPVTMEIGVFDETGKPLPDVTVGVHRESAGPLAEFVERARTGPAPPVAAATTGADGRAVLELPGATIWTVAARAPGRAFVVEARIRRAAGRPIEVALSLPRAERLTGRVLDAQGRPSPRAFVLARRRVPMFGFCGTCDPPADSAALWLRAEADDDGRYVLDALPPGQIEIVAGPAGGPGQYVGSVRVPDLPELDLELRPTASVEGRAVDADSGEPVAGVVVAAKSGGTAETARIGVTGADGRYVLDGIPAGSEVSFAWSAPDGWAGVRGAGLLGDDTVLRPGQTLRHDLTFRRAAVLTGRATRNGAPVPGATIDVVLLPRELRGWVPCRLEARTDAEGRYRAEGLLPGRAAAFATAPGDDADRAGDVFFDTVVHDESGRARESFELTAGGTVLRDFVIGPAPPPDPGRRTIEEMEETMFAGRERVTVRGRITAADGLPLAAPRVSCDTGEPDTPRALEFARAAAPDGSFEFEEHVAAEDRTVNVYAIDDRHPEATVAGVKVPADAREVTVQVVLPAMPVLRGRVVSGGEPVGGALVGADGAVVARSAADGTFALRCRPGEHAFGVEAPGFVRRIVEGVAVPNDEEVEIALERALSIAGRVASAKGAPVAGLLVTPRRDDVSAAGAVTDAEGRFRLEGLAAGDWRLRVESAPNSAARVVTQTTGPIAAGTDDAHVVVEPGLRIAGRVVDPGKEPVRNADVVCRPGPGGDEKAASRTDDDGRFSFDGLGDGAFSVGVTPSASTNMASARREVKAGTTDVVVELVASPEIRGVLVDEKGEPIAGEEIEAVCTDEDAEPVPRWRRDPTGTTEKDGTFRILVPKGTKFRLSIGKFAKLRDRAVLSGRVDVTAGASDVRLVADRSLGLRCVVVDAEGRPIAGAEVLMRLRGNERTLRTDENGRFGVSGVAKIDAAIRVRAKGHAPVQLYKVPTGGPEVRIVLSPALTISGRLVDAAGRPASRYGVRAFSPAFPGADLWRATLDAEGRFEIGELGAGEWYLEAFVAKGDQFVEQVPLGTRTAGSKDVELRLPE